MTASKVHKNNSWKWMLLHQIILGVAHVYLHPEWDFCQTMHFAEKMHLSRTLLQKILSDLDVAKVHESG